ncbi:MAG TPA: class II aldolase/adducin family protein [Jatrophihabitans sp.]|nr:class II aldolase/adducin family protein [Jatrophihabitans sp.]
MPAPADLETDADTNSLAELVATACQVLAVTGLTPDVLGHVSVRISAEQALVRCRGPRESGLAFTTADDARVVPLFGPPDPQLVGGWSLPNELPIHTAALRRHPHVTAVVHAHPPTVVAMSIAGLPWRPIIGAYDIPAARLAAAGIPTWPRAALVNTPELGDEVAGHLAERPVVVLYGHGLVSTGTGDPQRAVAEAVTNAYAVDTLARMTLAVARAGAEPAPIADRDLAQLPDLGAGFNVETMWRHLVRRAAGAARAGWR